MIKKTFSTLVLLAIFVLSYFILTPSMASAASLSIEPIRQELSLKPGQAASSSLSVRNTGTKEITVHLSAESFGVINENYDYAFDKEQDVKTWVKFDLQTALIKPGQSHAFSYTVGVPQTAEPGGKYIAIFSSTEEQGASGVRSVERAGLLTYITVPGATTRRGEVLTINMPIIATKKLSTVQIRESNAGSLHFNTKITTDTTNIIGRNHNINVDDHLLLPNTIRFLEQNFETGKYPGVYRIKLGVGRGDLPAYVTTRWVLYLPPFTSIVLATSLVFICSLIYNKIKKRK